MTFRQCKEQRDEAILRPHPSPPPQREKDKKDWIASGSPVLGLRHSVSKMRVNALMALIRVRAMRR